MTARARPRTIGGLALLAALAVLTGQARAQGGSGRYSAHVEVRSGTCCSQSCAGISTRADLTLTLSASGAATLHWSRTGCHVSVVPGAGEPAVMPRDPGAPEGFCGYAPPGAEVRSLTAEATWTGTWHGDGEATIVSLVPTTTLRCAPETIDGHAVLSCRLESPTTDTSGLTLDGRLYLARRPGLSEHLDPTTDQLVLEH